MAKMNESGRNRALWWGFVLALGAVLCNVVFFLNPPGQRVIPWLSVLLAVSALIFLASGLRSVFGPTQAYRSKILGSILAVVALLLAGVAIFAFFHARAVPVSAGAPRIGQTASDFTLADTSGQAVSMAQLFAPPARDAQTATPKAVLLIFYRGYW
jgi:hypothetical protein